MADPALEPKWRERFDFFETYGAPSSPEARAAFKALPNKKKRLLNMNWLGFFFGPVYFLVLGMWKRALTLLGVALLSVAIEFLFETLTGIQVPHAIDMGINMAFAMLFAVTANYSYYLKRVKGDDGWNPFEGMQW